LQSPVNQHQAQHLQPDRGNMSAYTNAPSPGYEKSRCSTLMDGPASAAVPPFACCGAAAAASESGPGAAVAAALDCCCTSATAWSFFASSSWRCFARRANGPSVGNSAAFAAFKPAPW